MAYIISGKALSDKIKKEVSEQVEKLKQQSINPCLAVVSVGSDQASAVYVRGKEKDCKECGIESKLIHLSEDTTQQQVLDKIVELAQDNTVHGILVQLPLPKHIDEKLVIEAIPPHKDVDGFTPVNVGKMVIGQECLLPCTPAGCIEMIKSTGIPIEGRHAVVVGRSNIVGKPLATLLLRENATVTVCHSCTDNLREMCLQADILVAAIGKANFITEDMIKPGAIVIDVGINRNSQGKICGDVDFVGACKRAKAITPVPGGVGLMTRAMLMKNTVKAAENNR